MGPAINRDPAFWDAIAQHPEVAPHVFMGETRSLEPLVTNPAVLPFASKNGGVIFVPADHLGFVLEMHTLYRPEGWGREVAAHAHVVMQAIFDKASLLLTHEQEGNWRSQPPKSHGWAVAGDFRDVGLPHKIRLWSLSREAWRASAVGRRLCH